MPWYYVMRPGLSTTAAVDAPTTEKARTTFLDYLERHGLIERAARQETRRNMVAKKIDDPNEVQTDLQLQYGYEEGGGYGRIPLTFEPSEVPEPSGDALQQINESEMQEDTHSSPTRRLSPIQKLSLGVRE